MKKTYEKPEVEVIVIEEKDIITDSVTINWLEIPEGDEVDV